MLPVTIEAAGERPPGEADRLSKPVRGYRTGGVIEIELHGARLVVKGAVDAETLRVALSALTSR